MEILVKDIKDAIKNSSRIALITHTNCDCDGIGSMCALYEYLEEHSKNVSMFCDSDIPIKYEFLNYFEKINVETINDFDLVISLDTSVVSRLGKYEELYSKHSNTINIDHHVSNSEYAKINYVRNYSSCGEVLYEILKDFGDEITEGVATSLLSAISADTNRFANANVTAVTHKYAGELIGLGADVNKVNVFLHKAKTFEQLKLAGFMATHLKQKNGVSYILITLKDLKKLKVLSSDVSPFLSLICDVIGSKITIVFKERESGEYRLNMRSVEDYDVNKVASVFGGGGHRNAAGCNIKGRFNKVLASVLKECSFEIAKRAKIDG